MATWYVCCTWLLAFSSGRVASATSSPLLPYENAALPISERVADLVSRMTIEEMVAQTLNPVGSSDGPGGFTVTAESIIAHYGACLSARCGFRLSYRVPSPLYPPTPPPPAGTTGLGTVYSGASCATRSGADCHNWLQQTMINASRLHIPVSFIGETLVSGCGGGTIFPQPVLRGATFDVALEAELAASIARQARAGGIDRALSPVLQVDTDARCVVCPDGGGAA